MNYKPILVKSMFVCALIFFEIQLSDGATITITGPTTICPNTAYPAKYTAYATNVFGAVNGFFDYAFLENGTWEYFGAIPCEGLSNASSIEFTRTWQHAEISQIRVRFRPNYVLCSGMDQQFAYINVRVFSPGAPLDVNGGLTFCSAGQTRTITIPGIPYDSIHCWYHYKYEWIVPAGWTVVPTGGISYTDIPGGIRTFATTVSVTSQSSGLASGFSGNYFITVRTEDSWGWPAQDSRQAWIGLYGTSMTISGQSGVCPGNVYTYTVTPPGGHIPPGHSYSWTKPANWSIQSQGATYLTVQVPSSDPNYGPVIASTDNGCGTDQNGITAYPGFGCGGFFSMAYPNPADNEIIVNLEGGEETHLTLKDSKGVVSNTQITKEKRVALPVAGLRNGTYYLHINQNGTKTVERIIIDH